MKKILAAGLLVASLSAHAVDYEVQLLQSLSAGGDSLAYGLNDNGTVVGQSFNSTTGQNEAAVWTNGVVASLGVKGLARAVNNSGTVVGETGDAFLGFPNGYAFSWSGSGPVTDLGTINDGLYSGAYDINDSGVITGFSCTNPTAACVFQSHGFRYDSGSMTDLGAVSVYSGYSRGHGINDSGEIAGRGSLVNFIDSDKHMAYWDSSNNLTSVINPNGTYSTAQQINNNGIIVGNGFNATGDMRGLVWDSNLNVTQLMGTFGGAQSRAWSINDIGTIVGFARDSSEANRAMVSYDGGATLVDLNSVALDLSGWQSLDVAYDINENGQIVGIGTLTDGTQGAFLLTAVPVPAAVWLFVSACAALFGFRRSAR
ncbi:MAG: hypothetical protein HKN56_09410 [Gammaproteobacteria bacterium]|nr:hypothetical protein [Gammaproteobacteria bacterium]NND55169.1 hypothetical protein [Gammaproteobacteria bacterium]